jgi:hypothetical protein
MLAKVGSAQQRVRGRVEVAAGVRVEVGLQGAQVGATQRGVGRGHLGDGQTVDDYRLMVHREVQGHHRNLVALQRGVGGQGRRGHREGIGVFDYQRLGRAKGEAGNAADRCRGR